MAKRRIVKYKPKIWEIQGFAKKKDWLRAFLDIRFTKQEIKDKYGIDWDKEMIAMGEETRKMSSGQL